MADTKISALPSASVPLAGTEALPIVQGGATDKVAAADLLRQTGQTVTVSNPVLSLAQTWNAGGVTFSADLINVTNTASDAASLVIDRQVGGVSVFSVRKDGLIVTANALTNCTDLPISSGVSGLGTGVATLLGAPTMTNLVAAITGDTPVGRATTDTLTNKRVTPRVSTVSVGTSSPQTPNSNNFDQYSYTGIGAALTIGADTGAPTVGQRLVIRLKDDGTARALTWNALYRAIGVTLPTTTVLNKTTYVGFIYNATDTKWDAVAVATEA